MGQYRPNQPGLHFPSPPLMRPRHFMNNGPNSPRVNFPFPPPPMRPRDFFINRPMHSSHLPISLPGDMDGSRINQRYFSYVRFPNPAATSTHVMNNGPITPATSKQRIGSNSNNFVDHNGFTTGHDHWSNNTNVNGNDKNRNSETGDVGTKVVVKQVTCDWTLEQMLQTEREKFNTKNTVSNLGLLRYFLDKLDELKTKERSLKLEMDSVYLEKKALKKQLAAIKEDIGL